MARITGTTLNDSLLGTDDDDEIEGGAGNDFIDGRAGVDTMRGGTGDDVYIVADGTFINPTTELILRGEPGSYIFEGSLNATPADGSFTAFLNDVNFDGRVDAMNVFYLDHDGYSANWFNVTVNTTALGVNLESGFYADAVRSPFLGPIPRPGLDVYGNHRGSNQTFGNFAINYIDIDYTSGTPVLQHLSMDFEQHSEFPTAPALFGTLNYNFSAELQPELVVELANQGNDTVRSAINYVLPENVENLVLTGFALRGTGNGLANRIEGNARANTLNGGAGADRMSGGAGNDVYIVDNIGDQVIELPGGGVDLVQSSVTYALWANVENLTLIGAASIDGTGNELDNVLTGNSGVNWLRGGRGNDTYIVDNARDTVVEQIDQGIDTVVSSINWGLHANLENLTLTGAAFSANGNSLDNVLTGNGAANHLSGAEGNDTLDGRAGADALFGGNGNDVYVVDNAGDTVTETATGGVDTVISAISYALGANVENLTLTGLAYEATGNARDNVITGNDEFNLLHGRDGNDVLDGGASFDYMDGGRGDDVYVVDHLSDLVIEQANEGIDLVRSSISVVLATHAENLTLIGDAAIDGTGNTIANTVTGNAANNVLDGGLGADVLIGGRGDDTYVVDPTDTVVELINEGIDTVVSYRSYTLGSMLENLTLGGMDAINGTGNDLDNVLTGNSGLNWLRGGRGNDTYVVDNARDTVVEQINQGIDTVVSSTNWALHANLENLALTGAAFSGIGNSLDNVITGNSGNNKLMGGAGNDVLEGGLGVDTLIGGAGDDTYEIDDASNGEFLLSMQGVPGTYLVPDSLFFTTFDGSFTVLAQDASGDGVADSLSLTYADRVPFGGHNWTLNLTTHMAGANLVPGTYLNAERAAFATPGHPGLDLSGDGRGSNQVFGSFTINEAVFDYSNGFSFVEHFSVDFKLHSESPSAPAILGRFNWNYTGAGIVPEPIVELANEGTDTVRTAFSYTLGANVENLVLTGTTINAAGKPVNGTGNALNNAITGNGASNTLTGGGGNDRLTGGDGSDTFDYNALADGRDAIADFTIGSGGDVLDVSDVLIGYTAGTSVLSSFVRLAANGSHTDVAVNADGAGSDFVTLATLENVAFRAGLLNELAAQGNLVV